MCCICIGVSHCLALRKAVHNVANHGSWFAHLTAEVSRWQPIRCGSRCACLFISATYGYFHWLLKSTWWNRICSPVFSIASLWFGLCLHSKASAFFSFFYFWLWTEHCSLHCSNWHECQVKFCMKMRNSYAMVTTLVMVFWIMFWMFVSLIYIYT